MITEAGQANGPKYVMENHFEYFRNSDYSHFGLIKYTFEESRCLEKSTEGLNFSVVNPCTNLTTVPRKHTTVEPRFCEPRCYDNFDLTLYNL